MQTEDITQTIQDIQKPYIKLEKNSRGYNWEIKLIGDSQEVLDKLREINHKLQEQYGVGGDDE